MNRHERRKLARISADHDGNVFLDRTEDNYEANFMQICMTCGKREDCRPYGVNSAWICFDCAQATPEARVQADKMFGELLDSKKDMH